MSTAPQATKRFANFIVATRFDELPAAAVKATNLAFYDWVGCVVNGSRTAVAAKVAAVVEEERAPGRAIVFANGKRTSPHWAALANGAASHSIELDDIHIGSIIHGGVVICSASLAAAEHMRADGRKLAEGLLVGFDVAHRVGEAIARSHYLKFHSTGTVGTLGAAASAAKIMGLSYEQTLWALGNAASQAAGLWQYLKRGDDTKVLHAGKASMNGVLAASLARRGFTGSDEAIEGERGFVATLSDEVDWDVMMDGLGRHYKVDENGYKIHACCRHGHVSIDQALKLRAENDLKADDIRKVRVELNKNACDTIGDANPLTSYKARFSIHYLMAQAFLYGRVGLEAFSDERLKEPGAQGFMRKVEMIENPEFTKAYPRLWTARVTVELNDGRLLRAMADLPEGDPQTIMPIEKFDRKFIDLVSPVAGSETATGLLRTLKDLPSVGDVSQLFSMFTR